MLLDCPTFTINGSEDKHSTAKIIRGAMQKINKIYLSRKMLYYTVFSSYLPSYTSKICSEFTTILLLLDVMISIG